MFWIMNFKQGFLVLFSVILLVISCFQAKEANQQISKINEENATNPHAPRLQTAPYGTLVCVVILLLIALLLPETMS